MQAAPTPSPYRVGGDLGGFVSRWIKIWVAVIGVVTIVAVIYLVWIVSILADINGNLAVAQNAVVDVGGETKTLPKQVESVNTSLKGIDEDVKPIQTNAQKIIASLQSIQGKLVNVDSSLVNTSGVLKTVLGGASDARGTLVAAQSLNSGGTNLIWRQVGDRDAPGTNGSLAAPSTLNGQLDVIRGDAGNAIGQLQRTNASLVRICTGLALLPSPGC